MSNYSKKKVIWDLNDNPTKNQIIWHLKSYKEDNNQKSILRYIESNSDYLREKYLKWIYDLGVRLEKINKILVEK